MYKKWIPEETSARGRYAKAVNLNKPKCNYLPQSAHILAFNIFATEKFKLLDFKYATLYYDKNEKSVGIAFSNKSTEDFVKVTHYKERKIVSISFKKFITFYKLKRETKKIFDLIKDEDVENFYTFIWS